ncbi:ribonuclease-like 3 [Oryzias latipes]
MKILLSCLLILMLVDDSSQSGYSNANARPYRRLVFKPIYTESKFDKFCMQHINEGMTDKDCDTVIKDRDIHYVQNNVKKCKETNTFIDSGKDEVENICKGKEMEDGKRTRSTKKFTIVRCTLKNIGASPPDCNYKGTLLNEMYLFVSCDNNNKPVHYDGETGVDFDDDNLEHGF